MRPRAGSPIVDAARLAELRRIGLLDTPPDPALDRLSHVAMLALHAPMAGITLVDRGRQFFKSAHGIPAYWTTGSGTTLEQSFCRHVVSYGRAFHVADTRVHRLTRGNPAVDDPGVLAYAGAPFRTGTGQVVGSLFVMDRLPHAWTSDDIAALEHLAHVASDLIERRVPPGGEASASTGSHGKNAGPRADATPFQVLVECSLTGVAIIQDCRFRYVNPRLEEIFGYSSEELLSLDSILEVVLHEDRQQVSTSIERRLSGETDTDRYTFRGRRKDGRVVHVEVLGGRIELDGRPATIGTVLDITDRVEAEEALADSERRFRGIFDQTYEFIGLLSPDGTVLEVNRSALEFGELSRETVVGRRFWEARWWTHDRDTQRRLKEAIGKAARGEFVRYETDVRGAGDRVATIDFSLRPVQDEAGRVSLLIPEGHDITDRKAAEDALRSSEERLAMVVRATREIVWEWDVKLGTVTWGPGAARAFRRTADEIEPTIDWWVDQIHADDRERVVTSLHEVVESIEEPWSAEYRRIRGDGSCATVLDRGCVVRNERGAPVRVIGSLLDVTERKRTEDTQRLLARASAALDASLDVEITFPALARISVPALADVCTISVLEGDEVRRVAGAHVVPTKEAALDVGECRPVAALPEEGSLARALRTGQSVLVPEEPPVHEHDAETGRPEPMIVVPMVAREEVLGAITFRITESKRHYGPADILAAEDLTHRAALALETARLYRDAQRALDLREQVLGVVSHDLRSPLSTIRMSASMLRDTMRERRADVARWIDVIHRSADQMNRMIQDLLDLSTIDAGGFSITQADHAVQAVVSEVCDLFDPLTKEKSIELECRAAPGTPSIWIDSDQILRVLSNLLGNALKFTPEGGRIVVLAEPEDGEVRFSVSDTGPGIAPEQLSHVFDRYWQARPGDRRGAGLGLAIAKGIVEAHDGRIRVESRPGEGTTFVFTVPIARPA